MKFVSIFSLMFLFLFHSAVLAHSTLNKHQREALKYYKQLLGLQVGKTVAHHLRNRIRGRGGIKVQFHLAKSGRITYVRILKSSGNKKVDQLVKKIISKSGNYSPPPRFAPSKLVFAVPIYFR